MPTFFQQIQRSFDKVEATPEVVTEEFLEACQGMLKLFDLLGSSSFSLVQSDMSGNIKKVRDRYESDRSGNATLQKLILGEKNEKNKTASQGLLWLMRGLQFVSVAMRRALDSPAEELNVSFGKAYDVTLKKYHSFVVRPVVSLALKACPYKAEFVKKLSDGKGQEAIQEDMKAWVAGLEKIVAEVMAFYTSGGYDKGL